MRFLFCSYLLYICFTAVKRNLEPVHLAALVGVVCAVIFIFTIVTLVVICNRKKNKGILLVILYTLTTTLFRQPFPIIDI